MQTRTTTNKTKRIVSSENIDQEFTDRALTLFASMYEESIAYDTIISFPSIEDNSDIPRESKIPLQFNSGIYDIRLRKSLEHSQNDITSISHEKFEQDIKNFTDDAFEEIFIPESGTRPDLPLYQRKLQEDDAILERSIKSKKTHCGLGFNTISKEFTNRIKVQNEKESERKKKRCERAKEVETEQTQFINSLYHSKGKH